MKNKIKKERKMHFDPQQTVSSAQLQLQIMKENKWEKKLKSRKEEENQSKLKGKVTEEEEWLHRKSTM